MQNISYIVKDDTALGITANTAFYTAGVKFDSAEIQTSLLQIAPSVGGVLTLVQGSVEVKLNGGNALNADALYAFEIAVVRGVTYNLKYSASGAAEVLWCSGGAL